MSDSHHRVTFQPQGRTVSVLKGATILEAAALAGLIINTPCGGSGACGKCRVRVTSGVAEAGGEDRAAFAPGEIAAGWRLACQNRINADMVLYVPRESLFGTDQAIMQDSTIDQPATVQPAIHKVHVTLPAPTLEDSRADLVRLEEQTGHFRVDVKMLREVPGRLRAWNYEGTVVLAGHHVIDFERGDTTDKCFGVAVDIGTTTMVLSLLNLCTGDELAVEARVNPQVSFGDDVLARIRHSTSCPECLEELRKAVIDEIGSMIQAACATAGINVGSVYEAVFAGNTTMQHLLCGVDPSPLGVVPFAPAYGRGMVLSAHDLDVPINPRGIVYIFPVIGGFVGGDTVAGMLATRLDEADGPVLMVDIGTNGEIVVGHHGMLLAASTAAGPAFEGARIKCGMRAMRGAIEKVIFSDDIQSGVIGDGDPVGICGSGIIDLMAELLRSGIVSPLGLMLPPEELPRNLSPALAARIQPDQNGRLAFVLSDSENDATKPTILFTQQDVRELQLGCGAIRAGITIVLQKAGISASDLKTIVIAGGFGGFIRRDKAQRLGLLPAEVEHHRIHYVGNSSLAGARLALLSLDARKRSEELARRTRHIELSTDTTFQEVFMDAMIFPG